MESFISDFFQILSFIESAPDLTLLPPDVDRLINDIMNFVNQFVNNIANYVKQFLDSISNALRDFINRFR